MNSRTAGRIRTFDYVNTFHIFSLQNRDYQSYLSWLTLSKLWNLSNLSSFSFFIFHLARVIESEYLITNFLIRGTFEFCRNCYLNLITHRVLIIEQRSFLIRPEI
jgi:hypothetical protein